MGKDNKLMLIAINIGLDDFIKCIIPLSDLGINKSPRVLAEYDWLFYFDRIISRKKLFRNYNECINLVFYIYNVIFSKNNGYNLKLRIKISVQNSSSWGISYSARRMKEFNRCTEIWKYISIYICFIQYKFELIILRIFMN